MSHSHSDHSHHHPHQHGHQPQSHHGRAFFIAIVLNSLFVVVEFVYGFIANSTALMADAGHNLSDVLALFMAWGTSLLSRRRPSQRYTYGLRSSTIMAAFANAILLLMTCGAIAWESVERFAEPPMVAGQLVTLIAAIGIVVNGASAWLFVKGSSGDLNIRGAYLHMLGDALVSLAVVMVGITLQFVAWYWLDPALSLIIVAVIVLGTWRLLGESLRLALNAVPPHIDVASIEQFLRQYPGVSEIHDLHIWGMSTTESALTVHLVMPNGYPGDTVLDDIVHSLEHRFAIHHSTLQVEQGTTSHACALTRLKK